ncbi:hypothetical protein BH11CYA1_BH11CYA1_13580 [soil metagenome]
MNTIEQRPPELASAVDLEPLCESSAEANFPPGADPETLNIPLEQKINGFDNGSRPLLKEPSLYLSIAIVFIASAVCFGRTPSLFWLSLAVMSSLAVAFHVMAERFLFRANKEHQIFDAPLEGVFVITLGAILPGLSLLAYGLVSLYSLAQREQANFAEEFAKLALLLVVPFFNFVVWSAVRKKYLMRPRLIGLMNGFAFGLSAAWSIIWACTVLFGQSNPSCKFGWMLLLCTAPLLLFASSCLGHDLWNKTDANIRRVTATFSVLGVLLSVLFVFAPMARATYVQSLVTSARQALPDFQGAAASALRAVATDEDLRPSKFPLDGFALAELLIPNRGLESGTDEDKDLYFKVTGNSYFAPVGGAAQDNAKSSKGSKIANSEPEPFNAIVGGKIPGLSLAKSQMAGNVDATTLSSSLDWNLTFHNASGAVQEARCEIAIPKQAVVSRVTLWIDGEPREAAFASSTKVQQAYQAQVSQKVDPLLVTMTAPDRLLVQCYPVPASGGEMKVRLGFKLPLDTNDGKTCSLTLPHMVASNFIQSKRQRLNIVSRDGYSMSGIVRAVKANGSENVLLMKRRAANSDIATLDWYSSKPRYIVQQLKAIRRPSIKRLFVVIDPSAALKPHAVQIKEAINSIPAKLGAVVSFAGKPAQVIINADAFEGGQDNWPALRESIESAAEQPDSAVVWIHGPQPIAPKLADSAVLDLVHHVSLFDLQIAPGVNAILPALQMEDASGLISYETLSTKSTDHETSVLDLKALSAIGEQSAKGAGKLVVQRTLVLTKPLCPIVSDRLISAQVTCLWAKEEVTKLLASGQQHEAQVLASTYRLVTPVSGAVVLENDRDYKANKLNPGAYRDALGKASSVVANIVAGVRGGLVGGPVDPRYGQSNEVGQLADCGYDAARDISRLISVIALLISIVVAIAFVRGRRKRGWSVYVKAAGIVVAAPMVVHLIGTFMINNCGGLGGGL